MAFSASILAPKGSFSAAETTAADTVYAKWLELEPRCDKGRDEVLRLRSDGPMVRWDGSGADAGLWLQVSFLRKPNNSLRLVAAASNITDKPQAVRLIARTIKDAFDRGASLVYYYTTPRVESLAPEWSKVLTAIVARLDELFPTVFAVKETADEFSRKWEILPA